MTTLADTLTQLAVGFALTVPPFLVGAFWQATRAAHWRDRAHDFQDMYEDLVDDLTRPAKPARPLSVVPDSCRACGSVGCHHEGCSALDRLDAGEVRA